MILPSKELLSEVLEFEVTSIYIAPNLKFIEAQSENRDERVNIYELAHKCKEWAYDNGYYIDSGKHKSYCEAEIGDLWGEPLGLRPEFKTTTEPEAIFKACEYILKQLSNK